MMGNENIWNTFLDAFEKKSKEVMEYSNAISKEIDKIENEIDNGESN